MMTDGGAGWDGGGAGTGYGWSPDVQRKGVAICLRDRDAWGQLGPKVFDAALFGHAPLRPVAETLFRACAEGGGRPPSPELFRELVLERAARSKPTVAAAIRQELELVLTADLSDARLFRGRLAEAARVHAVSKAILEAAELVERGAARNGHGTDILRLVQDALAVGQGSEAAVRLVGDGQGAILELAEDMPRLPTGFAALDRAMGGGAEVGLHLIGGVPKLGKTAFLTQVAVAAVRRGVTAWCVSGEVTLKPYVRRFASALSGLTKAEVRRGLAGVARVVQAYRQTGAELILEYAPAFTAEWMAGRLRQLEANGLRVGLVVADFLDIMGGKEYAERRHTLERNARALRDLAVDAGVRLWTAKAFNRLAEGVAKPTARHFGESFGSAFVVDNAIGLGATMDERGRSPAVVRLVYVMGRESEADRTVAAYVRDNDRQRWTEIPGYLEREAEGGATGSSGSGI